jgi:hypothetical protein
MSQNSQENEADSFDRRLAEARLTPAVSERDLLWLIFNAVCGLTTELTGKRMVVSFPMDDGETRYVYGDPVTFIDAPPRKLGSPGGS